MTTRDNPSIRALLTGRMMRQCRVAAGMEPKEVASILGVAQATISRWETGKNCASISMTARLLGLYRVPVADSDRLMRHLARVGERGWYEFSEPGLTELRELWADLEVEAWQVYTYQPRVVPRVLQTAAYAQSLAQRARTTAGPTHSPTTPTKLTPRDARLTVIIDECVVTTAGEPTIQAHQLRHLAACADLPNVSMHILPRGSVPNADPGAFTLLNFFSAPSLVHTWNLLSSAVVDTTHEVSCYRQVFTQLLLGTYPARTSSVLTQAQAGPSS